jgi:hypothetical protein
MPEQSDGKTRCPSCGRAGPVAERSFEGVGFRVGFKTCVRCAETLARAFDGVAAALRSGHGEKRERFLSKLMRQLERQGFESLPPERRPRASRRTS